MATGLTDARTAVEAASAEETARITATLIRVTGDRGLADRCGQEQGDRSNAECGQ